MLTHFENYFGIPFPLSKFGKPSYYRKTLIIILVEFRYEVYYHISTRSDCCARLHSRSHGKLGSCSLPRRHDALRCRTVAGQFQAAYCYRGSPRSGSSGTVIGFLIWNLARSTIASNQDSCEKNIVCNKKLFAVVWKFSYPEMVGHVVAQRRLRQLLGIPRSRLCIS